MTKIRDLNSYSASDISEAVKFSPALQSYLQFQYLPDQELHKKRNTLWCECALATILNTHNGYEVCRYWSEQSSLLVKQVFEDTFSSQSCAVFALGKLGSLELNLSSDVDLLIVAEELTDSLLKSLRQFQKILSERTPRGFLFRVDFDLRPGGRQGPLIPTVDQFVDYYGNYGETWERLAFVRLHFIAGDIKVAEPVQAFANKFTYRKHLDYTLLDDLKLLRTKIRQQYALRSNDKTWDLKLGAGAIRDVELFVHALQVVHGGKNPNLQVNETQVALNLLQETQILPKEDADFLTKHYWNLRQLENFIQSIQDEQTHLLNKVLALPAWAAALTAHLDTSLKRCEEIVNSLLGKVEISPTQEPTAPTSDIWQEILHIEVLSRNKERDEQARLQVLNEFSATLQKQGGDQEKALLHLKDFIKSTRAKASFFTLLLRNKSLMDKIAWLFGHSPYLSQILSSRPELMDSFVYSAQELNFEDMALLLEQLTEKRLLAELINGSQYLEDKNVEILQRNLSQTADEICEVLLSQLNKEYDSDVRILCLGKWGGQELGFRSDLDFVFVTQDEPQENDFKVVRRFINRLTEVRKGGSIYPIDMRLKPSGKAGPIVIAEVQLNLYLINEAEIWERQAYLKSRWLGSQYPVFHQEVFHQDLNRDNLEMLAHIRKELIQQTPDGWNLKYGEGGMLDIELFAQTYLLDQKIIPSNTDTLHFLSLIKRPADLLAKNYLRLRQLEQMLQLVSTEGGAKVVKNHESFPALARAFQLTPKKLEQELNSTFYENLRVLNQLDPRRQSTILA